MLLTDKFAVFWKGQKRNKDEIIIKGFWSAEALNNII